MKILTVGESPYLFTNSGKLNARILKHLKQYHDISGAVWNHDKTYFLPEDNGQSYFKDVCEIFPFALNENRLKSLYNIVLKTKPDIILAIGDYDKVDFISDLKALCTGFKLISLLLIDVPRIDNNYIEKFKFLDAAILTNSTSYEFISKSVPIDCSLSVVGANLQDCYPEPGIPNKFKIFSSAKNVKKSNLGGIISSCLDFDTYLHTNINDDDGYYNVKEISHKLENYKIRFPEKYSSIQENISDSEMRGNYSSSILFLDLPFSSATSMATYEAMACGCIPLVTPTVSSMDFLNYLPKEICLAKSVVYYNKNGESYQIVDHKAVSKQIKDIYKMWKSGSREFLEIREYCFKMSGRYLYDYLEKNIVKVIDRVYSIKNPIMVVEEFK